MSKHNTFRDRVLPTCGPGEGMTLAQWADCLRVFIPTATNDDAADAIRGCMSDGLLWWDGTEYVRPKGSAGSVVFGIDYDGTFSRDPDGFRAIVTVLRSRGHVCVCVTGRSDEGQYGAEVKRGINNLMPIVFAAGKWKAGAAERAGYRVDVWIDDMPEGVRELRADFAAFKNERERA